MQIWGDNWLNDVDILIKKIINKWSAFRNHTYLEHNFYESLDKLTFTRKLTIYIKHEQSTIWSGNSLTILDILIKKYFEVNCKLKSYLYRT